MPVIYVALGIVILLILIMVLRWNTFVSLIITSCLVAMMLGMPVTDIVSAIEKGIGSQLGHLALVFGFGAMLGRLVADAGGGYRIAATLITIFGKKNTQIAVVVASFTVGIALFFEVGLILLLPIIYAIARELKMPFLYLGIPMAAALNVTHGFLPPHPAPTAISLAYQADLGHVLLLGIAVGIPTTLVCGPLFNAVLYRVAPGLYHRSGNMSAFGEAKTYRLEETPGFLVSVLTSLAPVIFMGLATVVDLLFPHNDAVWIKTIEFIGTPGMAMLISLLIAFGTMGYARNRSTEEMGKTLSSAIAQISMMLLIIGGGGAFKQVIVEGGVGDYVAGLFQASSLSPIVITWTIAAILRLCLGSATVAALTTAGIVAPMLPMFQIDPALIVLATGAGSVTTCHVNDAGFWMIKESFGLTMKETFCSWTVLTTVLAVSGLIFILIAEKLFY
ncbi:gluconate:H+ symporter [uncultured Klebsiella sp.]|uniref:gluconate:H+ symporter n=1 Tax=uncultured Klebsiella sp. TaxID=284011 RepID=UPI0028065A6B|nr:gluconate:H+ symporter [uncultured Klebsiella sp.]